ncbi:hypothetical protein ZIOFF_038399 [Zingiber officinale]|uniref:Uncharacterized protein n=1 Tax=Zingiber officinale TaxID=94328 RepID=A0A8J5GEK5_ZINOF|nr:hypothetical protein ZIOFF_038399 [Zingiber officinale]
MRRTSLRRSSLRRSCGELAAFFPVAKCVLLRVSFGANIADFVARKAVEAGKLIESVKVIAQVLMYPFFTGTVSIHSELKLAG